VLFAPVTTRLRSRWGVALAALLGIALAGIGWLAFAADGGKKAKPRRASCARAVLADWADGRIDRVYPIRCYREAMKSLPADLEVYSSAPDDIARALRSSIMQRRR
jgi:hypothetical protein